MCVCVCRDRDRECVERKRKGLCREIECAVRVKIVRGSVCVEIERWRVRVKVAGVSVCV